MAPAHDRAPRYTVHERMAAGGMGEVYFGTMVSPAGHRMVAIKRLAADQLRDAAAGARLVAEARLNFQLTHANVCQVLDLVQSDDGTFIVMEYVRGLDLRAVTRRALRSSSPLDPALVLYIGREVARALDYVHRQVGANGRALRLVHGDVTPQNILLSHEGEVKLADFGIARALGIQGPGDHMRAGTRGFMAPEVIDGAFDHRADIYALGATLHSALTGSPPASPGAVRLDNTTASKDLIGILERATALEPSGRYLSAADFESALAFELARRYPGFTPSALSRAVRAALASDTVDRSEPSVTKTLFALESRVATIVDAAEPHATVSQLAPATQTVSPQLDDRTASVARRAPPRRHASLAASAMWVFGGLVLALVGYWVWPSSAGDSGSETAGWDAGRDSGAIVVASEDADAGRPPSDPSDGGTGRVIQVDDQRQARRRTRRSRAQTNKAVQPGYVSVSSTPWGKVLVDGVLVAKETPVYRLRTQPGTHRVTVVFGDGSGSKTRIVEVRSGQHTSLGFRR